MKAADIRSTFLKFFADRGHRAVPSSPVVPLGDPTLLFTNAGMNQFKDVFLGTEKRDYARACSSQKCIRAGGKHNDLENVGHTARHQTFFEMLGNFSFGDYFKKDAIAWAYELVTKGFGLEKARLSYTVFRDDEEAAALWREVAGVGDDRVIRLGEKDNFWSMGDTGPCGPCTEIHVDRGAERACGPSCGLGRCDCDRFMEVWNLVFMQFNRDASGKMTPLPKPSVDTGAGLERLAMVIQGVDSNYDTDLLRPLIARVEEISGRPYAEGAAEAGVPHRVIADHVRALSFAFADGALPSNEGRGYVLRRILRRAARYGRKLDLHRAFIFELVPALAEVMGGAYPELVARRDHVMRVIRSEEESFNLTLDRGLEEFEKVAARLEKERKRAIPGEDAFRLYDTYGFPVDLTRVMADERGMTVDEAGFEAALEEQRQRSRGAARFEAADLSVHGGALEEPTRFLGYGGTAGEGRILSFVMRDEGDGELILDETPFYAESGGQVGDTGVIEGSGFRFLIKDTRKQGGVIIHHGVLESLEGRVPRRGELVKATVDADRRELILKNHTATHLLHWALHRVLGPHATQQGSLVHPDYLRFDLTHFQPISEEEQTRIERLVNDKVRDNVEVRTHETSLVEAKAAGVIALFGEKYGERVRVVDTGGFSRELCGGTHVRRTGDIGCFKIVQEAGVAAGVRRIVAFTGPAAVERGLEERARLRELARLLSVPEDRIGERVKALLEQVKELKSQRRETDKRKQTLFADAVEGAEVAGVRLDIHKRPGASMDDLRALGDAAKKAKEPTVALFIAEQDGKVQLLAALTPDVAKRGVSAVDVLKAMTAVVGGGAGGRPDMAQAGGKDATKVDEAIEAAKTALRAKLGG